jgi:FlaA1/EpsC-like NDP-sugar epimerase
VLDMGEPVCIDDVARRLASHAERPVEIVYTGLRQGEKVHEVLLGQGEVDQRPCHPLISHVSVPPVDIGKVRMATTGLGDDDLMVELRALSFPSTSSDSVDRADQPGS